MMYASQLAFLNPIAWTQTSRASDPIRLKAEFKLYPGKKTGMLILHAKMPDENYIYSLTQKKIPPPTKLIVEKNEKFKVTGKFKPDKKPTVIEKDEVFNNRIEKHYKTVVFSAPIQLADDADADSLKITVTMNGQVCNEQNCTMIRAKKAVAKFGGTLKKKPKTTKSN
jgi:hypothetical protein